MTQAETFSLHLDSQDVLAVLRSILLSRYLPGRAEMQPFASFTSVAVPGVLAVLPPERRLAFANDALFFFGRPDDAAACRRLAGAMDLHQWCEEISSGWDQKPEMCVFSTSGSTGMPKTFYYPFTVLEEEAEALAPYFAEAARVVTVMPAHHIFGFVTSVLLPKRLGIPVLCLPPLPVGELFQSLNPDDLLIAFPLFWQAVLERLESYGRNARLRLPDDLHGLSSSAPCPPEIIEKLTRPSGGGGAPYFNTIAEIYGTTETSAVGIRTACRGPYTLLPIWKHVTLPDGSEGIARIRGNGRCEDPVAVPDVVDWFGSSAFVPLRRKDNAVQVGGVNVYPQQVAEIIRRHAAVEDCAVRLMRPEEGSRLKAFIVPKAAYRDKGREIFGRPFRAWMRERLETAAIPKSITIGDELPRTVSGKSKDWPCRDTTGIMAMDEAKT